ncbi:FAD-binding domain-containing protein [Aspergillus bertholletiae]|uniref:FAD-binding domain-containing protein n=1 Tax=Aspergillus bertholletiae TaxID=1226010 RepID=A0A5N7AR17_9EURO|nr:FAD-binding domain-containing protein [Aspergillus bertholletiae]
MDHFFEFLASNPRIQYATPTSPDFDNWRPGFVVDEDTIPAVIVRPPFAEDVAALVSVLVTHNLPFSVRAGGHDMFGRSQIHDAITVDLREIAYVDIDHGGSTVRVGGGILVADLIKELEKQGLVTPHGLIPSVGYVGLATHGGYGLLSAQYGLGVDQILAARVVDCHDGIRDADKDMLTAIRGGGGMLGVIVEVTIKVYPLGQVLAGAMIYDSSNLSMAISRYNNAYRQLKQDSVPSALNLYQSVMNGPTGKALTVLFCWASSDMETGLLWLSKIQDCSPVALCIVSPTTMAAFSLAIEQFMPKRVHGTVLTANIHQLTPELVSVIGFHSSLQPNDSAILFGIHELRTCTPPSSLDSVISTRSPHFVLEITAIVETPDLLHDAIKWGQLFYDAVHKTDPANGMPSTYLPLTSPEKVDIGAIYGAKLQFLRDIKQRYDSRNVFRHTLVQL